MVESINNNHSVEQKSVSMRTFTIDDDSTVIAKMSPGGVMRDGLIEDVGAFDALDSGIRETVFEGSVEHKNNSNHTQQAFFGQFDPLTLRDNGVEELRLSSTHSSPTLSHHECFQPDSTTYSAPNSPHGKPPLSRHPKKKLIRRQSSPPTSTNNARMIYWRRMNRTLRPTRRAPAANSGGVSSSDSRLETKRNYRGNQDSCPSGNARCKRKRSQKTKR